MFHIPLFAALILPFNMALFKFVSSDYHGTKWRTKHTSPIQQRQHEHQYISDFFLSFRSLPPVHLTFLAQIQTQFPTTYTYIRHYLLTPRTTIHTTGTTDHGLSNSPTKTQLHLFSYALFVTPLIFNLRIRWRRVVKFMPRPFDPWKKCRYSWSMKMGWPQSQFGCFADWIKLSSVPGCESRTAQAVG